MFPDFVVFDSNGLRFGPRLGKLGSQGFDLFVVTGLYVGFGIDQAAILFIQSVYSELKFSLVGVRVLCLDHGFELF